MTNVPSSIGLRAKHNQAAALVAEMTLEEKAAFCSGRGFWYLERCERLGIRSVMVTDGPHGLRKQDTTADHVGLNASVPATCFPTASALASSWDIDLLSEIGVALGQQSAAENVAVLLGPGMNIKRHPLCGRNFEYFSEDPLLTGELAAAMINGVQSMGVGTSVKHFAVNNQEHGRMFVDAIVDERTLREIYLRGFQIAVQLSQPWTVMCAYNRVNGVYCSEHDWLLNTVLREEWGFEGAVVTDWGAANDRVAGVASGLDLEMPSSGGINDARVLAGVQSGRLSERDLDQAITRVVSLSLLGADLSEEQRSVDQDAHHALARTAAAESAVLLKNESALLPLDPQVHAQVNAPVHVAVIGEFAKRPRYQGAGSSQVTPTRIDSLYDAVVERVGDQNMTYAAGYDHEKSALDEPTRRIACEVARNAGYVILCVGLPGIYESEGFDREHLRLPVQHERLIDEVCAVNTNVVVVLFNGAPIEMPWGHAPQAILEGYLAGQAGGSALADVLFGFANPCGKLAETFPVRQSDVPTDALFPGSHRQVQHREGLYVGYRYFDSANKPVLYPFGHGLSYTEFDYSNVRVLGSDVDSGNVTLTFKVANIGDRTGKEVIQIYVHDVQSTLYRPDQELRAFRKIELQPDTEQTVSMTLTREAFAAFDTSGNGWVVEAGEFEIRVGSSSRDIRLASTISVASDDSVCEAPAANPLRSDGSFDWSDATFASALGRPVPAPESTRPFHMNSSVSEIAQTWLGAKFKNRVVDQFVQRMGGGGSDVNRKMFERMVNDMPLRALALFGGSSLSFERLQAFIALLNGQYVKALKRLISKSDVSFLNTGSK